MCGIAGVRRFGADPITPDMLKLLLLGNEHRGTHATGIALQQRDGKISVLKADEIAWKFVNSDKFKAFLTASLTNDTIIALLHTRAATQGSPRQNENNHPMWDGKTAIIHNGTIANDDYLFDTLKLKRVAETDSDIIRAIISKHGINRKSIRILDQMAGSCAAACITAKQPGELLLLHSGSPLQIGTVNVGTRRFMTWSSIRGPIHKAMRPVVSCFGLTLHSPISQTAFISVDQDNAWIFGDEGRKMHQAFSSASYTSINKAYTCYQNHYRKNSDWDKEIEAAKRPQEKLEVDFIQCPSKKCALAIDMSKHKNPALDKLFCPDCNARLDGEGLKDD